MLNMQTKRGCPFKCIYCTYPHIEGRRFRFTEPEEVADTARMLQDAGARYLYMTDSTFNGSYEHSLEVAAAFKKAGISIPWGGFFTPTAPPPDYYQHSCRRGIDACGIRHGISLKSVLDSYGKPFHIDDVFSSHREALAAGLHVAHYLMLGGPGENEDTLKETLANADRLGKAVFFVFNGIRIYPHTALYDLALEEGQIEPNWNLTGTEVLLVAGLAPGDSYGTCEKSCRQPDQLGFRFRISADVQNNCKAACTGLMWSPVGAIDPMKHDVERAGYVSPAVITGFCRSLPCGNAILLFLFALVVYSPCCFYYSLCGGPVFPFQGFLFACHQPRAYGQNLRVPDI